MAVAGLNALPVALDHQIAMATTSALRTDG